MRILGEGLWEAQEQFLREMAAHDHVCALKARKLGQSTIAAPTTGSSCASVTVTRVSISSRAARRLRWSCWRRSGSGSRTCRRFCTTDALDRAPARARRRSA